MRKARMPPATLETPDFAAASVEPLSMLRRAGIIFLLAFVVGILLPGLAAWRSGVLYDQDVEAKLQTIPELQGPARRLQDYRNQIGAIETATARVDSFLLQSPQNLDEPAKVTAALQLRAFLQNEPKSRRPPITASGFYLSNTMLLWPAMYTCLGWLVFLLSPSIPAGQRPGVRKKTLWLILGILILYRWPVWARNFVFHEQGRVYYGSANVDVDPLGFFVQEGLGLVVAVLLAMLWLRWSIGFNVRRAELSIERADPIEAAFDSQNAERLSGTFLHWQVCSVILALGFIWYTYFFWDIVIRVGDQRYVINAIVIHLLWLVSLVFISLPLIITWHAWNSVKSKAVAALIIHQHEKKYDVELTLAALRELQPIGYWNAIASSVGVLGSLILPVIQAALK